MSEDRRVVAARTYLADVMAHPDDPEGSVIRDLLAYADERLKVNVGLISEITALKKAAQSAPPADDQGRGSR